MKSRNILLLLILSFAASTMAQAGLFGRKGRLDGLSAPASFSH